MATGGDGPGACRPSRCEAGTLWLCPWPPVAEGGTCEEFWLVTTPPLWWWLLLLGGLGSGMSVAGEVKGQRSRVGRLEY